MCVRVTTPDPENTYTAEYVVNLLRHFRGVN